MMRKQGVAVFEIQKILKSELRVKHDKAQEIAEKIFKKVVEPAVESEREEWILLCAVRPTDSADDDK